MNMMERIMLLTDGEVITKDNVIAAYEDDKEEIMASSKTIAPLEEVLAEEKMENKNLAQMEKELLAKVLAEENYNYSKAAKRLGIHRTTLWRKLKK